MKNVCRRYHRDLSPRERVRSRSDAGDMLAKIDTKYSRGRHVDYLLAATFRYAREFFSIARGKKKCNARGKRRWTDLIDDEIDERDKSTWLQEVYLFYVVNLCKVD